MRATGCLAAGLVLAATAAEAELTLCNRTDAKAQVAIAYSDGGIWVSEGWWGIDPAACKPVLTGKLAQRHYYYTLSGAGDFPGEGYAFCVTAEPFTLRGTSRASAVRMTPRPTSQSSSSRSITHGPDSVKA